MCWTPKTSRLQPIMTYVCARTMSTCSMPEGCICARQKTATCAIGALPETINGCAAYAPIANCRCC
ncbi:MAG: hypothetical protein RML72_08815 [Bacteroidia bacterium]|nr:hypothetical protein [Bacteroidia bacterium]